MSPVEYSSGEPEPAVLSVTSAREIDPPPRSVAKTPFDPELEAVMSVPSMTVVESSPTVSDTELVPE